MKSHMLCPCRRSLRRWRSPAIGADANAGTHVLPPRSARCATAPKPNDNGGAQGPSLQGVLGRKAATSTDFSYSAALKKSSLTWDGAHAGSLPGSAHHGGARFVDGHSRASSRPIARICVAYFTAVRDGTLPAAGRRWSPAWWRVRAASGPPPPPPQPLPTGRGRLEEGRAGSCAPGRSQQAACALRHAVGEQLPARGAEACWREAVAAAGLQGRCLPHRPRPVRAP